MNLCETCAGEGVITVAPGGNPDRELTLACPACEGPGTSDDHDDDYERAAARAHGNDFEDTNGNDWT